MCFDFVSGHAMDDPRITRAISICKKVVSGFSCSWKRRRGLGEAQQQLGLPSHQLITESATRWGSRLGGTWSKRGLFPKCHLQTRALIYQTNVEMSANLNAWGVREILR